VTQLQQFAVVAAAALAAGAGILVLLSLIPATATQARALWHLMRTEIVIVAVTLAIFLAGTVALGIATVAIAARVGFESAQVWSVARAMPDGERRRLALTVGLGLALATAALALLPVPVNFIAAACLVAALFAVVAIVDARARTFGVVARALAFPGLAVFALTLATREPRGQVALLLAFIFTELFDSFAVLGGRLFGRHRLFPRLSPNKTVEGLLAGLGVLFVVALALPAAVDVSFAVAVLAAAVTAVAAVAGDVLGSMPKRRAGVKDYPAVMREQGGLLDILDAWLVVGPVVAALWLIS
jgi:phosphatidate cytidylyltransferase